ncbi:hypothetical protein I3842_08G149000 [Carya illinoinensis]|uniref:Transmembrane protein n=1 Tax=Carya illinoinensis TaxID=32201 RepID=A0A922EDB4_CARIL|nr:hypothetical protein I3842_08G149000 [Carya illinoinensis]
MEPGNFSYNSVLSIRLTTTTTMMVMVNSGACYFSLSIDGIGFWTDPLYMCVCVCVVWLFYFIFLAS